MGMIVKRFHGLQTRFDIDIIGVFMINFDTRMHAEPVISYRGVGLFDSKGRSHRRPMTVTAGCETAETAPGQAHSFCQGLIELLRCNHFLTFL